MGIFFGLIAGIIRAFQLFYNGFHRTVNAFGLSGGFFVCFLFFSKFENVSSPIVSRSDYYFFLFNFFRSDYVSLCRSAVTQSALECGL